MPIRDTQDALIVEQPFTGGHLRDTQDALIVEWPIGSAQVRVTQDAMLCEFPFIGAMFVYQPDGSPTSIGFTPQLPPVKKQPLYQWGLQAARHDSITAAGAKRSTLTRLDGVTTLTFPMVLQSDMAAWKSFEQYALSGGTFAYCPSYDPWMKLDNTGFSTFRLLDMEWSPKFESPQVFSLTMQLVLVKDM